MSISSVARLFACVLAVAWLTGAPAAAAPKVTVQEVFRGPAVKDPVLLKSVEPTYPDAARQRRLTGMVVLEAVVVPDGSVAVIRVVRSLDRESGLDEAAWCAALRWRFKPARLDDRPVATLVKLELEFRLDSKANDTTAEEPPVEPFYAGAYEQTGRGVVPPQAVDKVVPVYPAEAVRAKHKGTVLVEAVVTEFGRVSRLRLRMADADSALNDAALQAVGRWTFQEGRHDGIPAPVVAMVLVQFGTR